MEKLEKHIKNKLEERTLRPSNEAWSKIAGQLDNKATNRKNYGWLSAAVIALLISLLGVFMFNNQEEPQTPIVLVPENSKLSNTKEGMLINDEVEITTNSAQVNSMEESIVNTSTNTPLTTDIETSLASNETPKQPFEVADSFMNKSENSFKDDALVNQKLNQVLLVVNQLENSNTEVSDAELDSLLLQAQREIFKERLNDSNRSVDAMALLNEVELELYDEATNPLFKQLKKAFLNCERPSQTEIIKIFINQKSFRFRVVW